MNVRELCKREAVTVREFDELTDAAKLMREQHVGYLVVVEPVVSDRGYRPVGVLTDRDIAIGVVARGVDPRSLRVGDLMSRKPVVVDESSSIEAALSEMRRIGVRRLPVVTDGGLLAGVISMDEALYTLSAAMVSVAGAIKNEQRLETELRR